MQFYNSVNRLLKIEKFLKANKYKFYILLIKNNLIKYNYYKFNFSFVKFCLVKIFSKSKIF